MDYFWNKKYAKKKLLISHKDIMGGNLMKKIIYPVMGFLMLFVAGCGESEASSFSKESTTIADFVKFYEKETGAKLTLDEKISDLIGASEGFGITNKALSVNQASEIYRFVKDPTEKNYPVLPHMVKDCSGGDTKLITKGFFFMCVNRPKLLPELDSVIEKF